MPTVVTACYGDRHAHFLGALLESLAESRPPMRTIVVHDGVSWLDRYPFVESVGSVADFGETRDQRLARRQLAWCMGLARVKDGTDVMFLDADTMANASIDPAFSVSYDVAFTARPESPWPINAGVVFLRCSPRTRAFMSSWRDLTELLSGHLFLREEARGRWGAVDQAALYMTRGLFSGKEPLSFHVLPCKRWNAVEDSTAAIHHLKGLLPFLLGEREFTQRDEHFGHDHTALFGRWRALYRLHRERIGM